MIHPPPIGRKLSLRIFRYICTDYLITLVACAAAFQALFLIASLIDNLDDFIKHGAAVGQIVRYFILVQPDHVVNVMPMSLLMAAMYVVSSLCRNHELTALRASGLSLFQWSLPVWVVAGAFSIAHFVTTEWVAPRSRQESEQLKSRLIDPYQKRVKRGKPYLAFRNSAGMRDWFFENFAGHGISTNVMITQYRPDRSVDWDLAAREANFENGIWTFTDVVRRQFDADGYLVLGEPEIAPFLRDERLSENPESFVFLFKLRPMDELSALRVRQIVRERGDQLSRSTKAVLSTYFYFYLFSPLTCLIAVFLGVPLAVTQERGSVVRNFILALVIMATYYLLAQIAVVFGKNQYIPPVIAGGLPSLLLIGFGAWQMRRLP